MHNIRDQIIEQVGDSIEYQIGKQLWMELNDKVDFNLVTMKVKESISLRLFNMIQAQLSYNKCNQYDL